MDTNIVRDIANIYADQVAIDEALDPVGKEDDDLNNNGIPNDKSDKYLKKRRKAINKAISTQEAKEVKRWWDDDGDDIGYEPGEVSGNFKKKKKKIKEGFSNWREDLVEVMDVIGKEENDEQITENPHIKNKIKINPSMGEAVENLGGTLLEMVEIEDFEEVFDELSESDIFFLTDDLIEEVVEEVFEEYIQEGYSVFEIENVLLESLEVSSALLNEAKVTYGHDTDVKSDRLEKVKTAVKKVGKGILRGAGYVAGAAVRGAKAVGRELGAGYKRGRHGSNRSSDSDSSSGSSSSGGSSRVTQGKGSSRPGLLGRIGSALKKGLRRILYKGAKAVERGAGAVARRTADNDGVRSASPRSGIGGGKKVEVTGSKESKVAQGKGRERSADQEEPVKKVSVKVVTATPKKPETRTGQPGPERKALPPAKSSDRRKKAEQTAADSAQLKPSKGVRIAGPGGVSPLVTTKKDAAAVSPAAAGAPKRPAKKTKVTAATPAATKPPARSKRKPKSDVAARMERAATNQGIGEEYQLSEMSVSKDQQKLFGLALSVKRGETSRSEVSAEVLKIVDTMSEKKIRDFAKTSHEGLPTKVQTKEEAIREALLDRMLEKIEEQQLDEFWPAVAAGAALAAGAYGASKMMQKDRKNVQSGTSKPRPGTIQSNIQNRRAQEAELMR